MDVTDDRLAAWMNVHMLDPDGLLALATHSTESLDLGREGSLQFDRQIGIHGQMLGVLGALGAAEHFHGQRMTTRHLHRQCTFQFVLWSDRLHQRQSRIDTHWLIPAVIASSSDCRFERGKVAVQEAARRRTESVEHLVAIAGRIVVR